MQLRPGGMDIFYVDESHDKRQYVVTAIAVPFMRPDASGWEIVWQNYLEAARLGVAKFVTLTNFQLQKNCIELIWPAGGATTSTEKDS